MKILSKEEIQEHQAYTRKGALLGCAVGLTLSAIGFKVLPKKFPKFQPSTLPWSIRTAFFIAPPTFFTVIAAEEASNKFDNLRYSSEYDQEVQKERDAEWAKLSTLQKSFHWFDNNKYKLITTIWAGSLWGSWHLINRDKIMTTAQKTVQARMYAQFITVVLLLASVGISQLEQNIEGDTAASKYKLREERRWERALKAAEEEETNEQRVRGKSFTTNQDRIDAKIFKH